MWWYFGGRIFNLDHIRMIWISEQEDGTFSILGVYSNGDTSVLMSGCMKKEYAEMILDEIANYEDDFDD